VPATGSGWASEREEVALGRQGRPPPAHGTVSPGVRTARGSAAVESRPPAPAPGVTEGGKGRPRNDGQCAFHRQRRRGGRPTSRRCLRLVTTRCSWFPDALVTTPRRGLAPRQQRSHPPRGTRSRSRSPDPWPCVDVSGHLPDRAVRDAPAGLAQRVALSLAPAAFAASVKVVARAVRRRCHLAPWLARRPGHNDERAARDRVAHCPAIPLTERVG
jgi:hypothetical protein